MRNQHKVALALAMLLAFLAAVNNWRWASGCWLAAAGFSMTQLDAEWCMRPFKPRGLVAVLGVLVRAAGLVCIFLEV